MGTEVQTDGRRARRERNRAAVIDALFELLREGRRFPPVVEEVAERAQVSVSSVFRYFDSVDDLHAQTIERYFERYAPLFEVPAHPDGSREERIAALVDARLELYETIAPIARMARARAASEDEIAETLADTRRRFARQVRRHLVPDLEGLADADDRADLVDGLTSFEAWDLLRTTHGRSRGAIRRAWLAGLDRLLG